MPQLSSGPYGHRLSRRSHRNLPGLWGRLAGLRATAQHCPRAPARFSEKECLAVAQAAKITYVKLPTLDRHLVCPKCGGITHPINYGDDSGIIVDKCASCNGIWLDRGELDKIEELIEGWHDELPDDLAQYGPKLRQVATDVDADLRVHISHIRLIDSAINGILDYFGE